MFNIDDDTLLKYIYLKSCGSTNEYANSIVSNNGPIMNTCIYTFNQTVGRGQIGRNWYSDTDKNLTSSYLIYLTDFDIKDQFHINIAFSLAIYDFICYWVDSADISSKVKIKWPNDIYLGDDKIAGLLIQNTIRADKISNTTLGVGININQDTFPLDLPNPTSLYLTTRLNYDLMEMQLLLSDFIHNRMKAVKDEAHFDEYLQHLYRLNKAALYSKDGETFLATLRGISNEGKLELEINGRRRYFAFREISFVI